jgi:hypothetical protein
MGTSVGKPYARIVVHNSATNFYKTICRWVHSRKQNIILKKIMNNTAAAVTRKPQRPNQNGPGGTFFLPVIKCGAIARIYEVVVRMIKEPARSWKAVLLPKGIAPRPVHRIAQNTVAGMGQLSFSFTYEKKYEKGVALSRARVHQMRPTVRKVPMTQIRREKQMMRRRPKVAPLLLLVACA